MILNSLKEKYIHYRLNRAYQRAQWVTGHDKIIIFSDHHKGVRDGADDFAQCEFTYQKALDYYYQAGYALVLLGDVEELWENDIHDVMIANEPSFRQEAQFYRDQRYYRCFGNHDLQWSRPQWVNQYFETDYPGLVVAESLLVEMGQRRFLLTHGHQGELMSDLFAPFSKIMVRTFWSWFQRLTNHKLSSLSDDLSQVQWHDDVLYRWISSQSNLNLITGHTHRPIWLSQTQAEQCSAVLTHKRPIYFNTGCCSYLDGDITGIELHKDSMHLIKFSLNSSSKIVLASLDESNMGLSQNRKI